MGADSNEISFEQISQLLFGLEHRGLDATGICLQNRTGALVTLKAPEPAWQFVTGDACRKWIKQHLNADTMTCILHTRAATLGTPQENENNHPLTVGKVAVVHNGVIGNHRDLFSRMKLKRNGEVDSDIIRAILDEHGLTEDGVENLNHMSGFAAIAAVSSAQPDHLLLARSGSPLVVAAIPETNQLMWASEKSPIHAACRPWQRKWSLWFKENHKDLMFNPFHREMAVLLTSEGVQWEMDFSSTAGGRKHNVVYRQYDNYADKTKRKREEDNRKNAEAAARNSAPEPSSKPVRMKCPSPTCGLLLKFRPDQEKLPFYKLECPKCSTRLGDQA